MLGLIKKDFLLIKANLKSMLIIFIVYFMLAFQGTFEVAFVIPVIGIMIFISTFSYDDFNNWNSYAVTLPAGRKNVVIAKYIGSVILMMLLVTVTFLTEIIVCYTKNSVLDLNEIVSSMMITLLSSVLIISLLYPMVCKFGVTNARVILFVAVFVIVGIGTLVMKYADMTSFADIVSIIDKYSIIIIPVISVILLGISYLISYKIYQNKEF